jgi:transcription antitermination factor NusG
MSACTQPAVGGFSATATAFERAPGVNWYVVYTRPRHEKRVVEQCQQRGVVTFLPLYSAERVWKSRKAQVELPVFPTYIFVHMSLEERLKVLTIPSAISLVSFQGAPAAVPDEQIEALSNAIARGKVEPHEYLQPGKRVRINGGPFAGLEGVIVRGEKHVRFVVSFHWMCRSVCVLLDAADLEHVAA